MPLPYTEILPQTKSPSSKKHHKFPKVSASKNIYPQIIGIKKRIPKYLRYSPQRSRQNPRQSYQLKIVDTFLASFTNGALQNDPVDEGGWFSQMLASRKTTAEYTKLTKNSVVSVRSVAQ
jgi:hypothetical protein